MTTEIELLPMPEGEAFGVIQAWSRDQMRDYARANVAHAVAPLQAEVETLRAEVDALRKALAELITWIPSADTYRRLGFDPEAPMRVLREARAALSKENRND